MHEQCLLNWICPWWGYVSWIHCATTRISCKSSSVEAPRHVFVGWAGSHANLQWTLASASPVAMMASFYALEEKRQILARLWKNSVKLTSPFWGILRFIPSSLAPWVAQLVIASAMTLDTSAGSLCNDRPSAPPSGSDIRKMWDNILYYSFYVDSLDLKTLKQ